MITFSRAKRLTLLAAVALIAGCAGNDPVRYTGLESSSQLTPNTGDESDRIPFHYSPQTDWKNITASLLTR